MAQATSKNDDEKVVDVKDNHDRVAMLSVAKDGSPDQLDPEIIGDKDFALKATERQFAENAVSAVDDANRAVEDSETVKQDPTIKAAQKEHEKAAKKAKSAADKIVNKLHED